MTLRTSRRRVAQTALATAAVATLPRSRAAAAQATPVPGEAAITFAQVQSAVDRLDGLIEDGMAQTGLPGAAVAVVYNDEVVYERGFGVREVGKPEPITPETVFQIASLSKSISSTLVAAVVGDDTTTWDATIGSLEPGFALADPWVSDQVTIRDMLCHRSGLPAFGGDPLVFNFGYDRDECLRRLRYYSLATPFRTTWAYSNLGFSAGAYAAAQAAGESWEDLAETRLFAPLGMTSSSYRFADFGRHENRAAPHYRTRDGVWELGDLTDDDAATPAGGVSSNLRDLTHWLRLHLAGGTFDGQEVVANDPLRETYRPQIVAFSPPDPTAGPTAFYGLGWFVSYDDRGRLEVTHGGDFNSYSTQATLLPGSGLGILVLCNGGASAVRGAIPKAFLEMVTKGEPSQDWVSAIETSFAAGLASILATSTQFPQGEPPADAAPPLPLDAYTGTFTNTTYGEVTVRDEAGGLVLKFGPNGVQHQLNAWDRDAFSYLLTGSEGAQLAQYGVLFTVCPEGQADSALVSLAGVGPDAAATFTRVTANA
ncbi:MAG TPA: serine hydrolase [Pseudonocardiaceae bacterium]|nr:serine hydrolase [Pseudonocardiaceae bacterium]